MAPKVTRKVIGQRPADLPESWLIFNAPRPLWGHRSWEGDFFHGRFYAAIDPQGEDAAEMIRDNNESDAWTIEYVSEEQAVAESLAYYETFSLNLEIDPADPEQRRQLLEGWWQRAARGVKN